MKKISVLFFIFFSQLEARVIVTGGGTSTQPQPTVTSAEQLTKIYGVTRQEAIAKLQDFISGKMTLKPTEVESYMTRILTDVKSSGLSREEITLVAKANEKLEPSSKSQTSTVDLDRSYGVTLQEATKYLKDLAGNPNATIDTNTLAKNIARASASPSEDTLNLISKIYVNMQSRGIVPTPPSPPKGGTPPPPPVPPVAPGSKPAPAPTPIAPTPGPVKSELTDAEKRSADNEVIKQFEAIFKNTDIDLSKISISIKGKDSGKLVEYLKNFVKDKNLEEGLKSFVSDAKLAKFLEKFKNDVLQKIKEILFFKDEHKAELDGIVQNIDKIFRNAILAFARSKTRDELIQILSVSQQETSDEALNATVEGVTTVEDWKKNLEGLKNNPKFYSVKGLFEDEPKMQFTSLFNFLSDEKIKKIVEKADKDGLSDDKAAESFLKQIKPSMDRIYFDSSEGLFAPGKTAQLQVVQNILKNKIKQFRESKQKSEAAALGNIIADFAKNNNLVSAIKFLNNLDAIAKRQNINLSDKIAAVIKKLNESILPEQKEMFKTDLESLLAALAPIKDAEKPALTKLLDLIIDEKLKGFKVAALFRDSKTAEDFVSSLKSLTGKDLKNQLVGKYATYEDALQAFVLLKLVDEIKEEQKLQFYNLIGAHGVIFKIFDAFNTKYRGKLSGFDSVTNIPDLSALLTLAFSALDKGEIPSNVQFTLTKDEERDDKKVASNIINLQKYKYSIRGLKLDSNGKFKGKMGSLIIDVQKAATVKDQAEKEAVKKNMIEHLKALGLSVADAVSPAIVAPADNKKGNLGGVIVELLDLISSFYKKKLVLSIDEINKNLEDLNDGGGNFFLSDFPRKQNRDAYSKWVSKLDSVVSALQTKNYKDAKAKLELIISTQPDNALIKYLKGVAEQLGVIAASIAPETSSGQSPSVPSKTPTPGVTPPPPPPPPLPKK
ncbi:TPA: hypothetical protein DEO28_01810 [Candidatus Dependentiae bacterium]|nr:MAG: hypothetical protein UR14_C0004G0052 [candidate division TM6 bacterium GW2011_GWE2_31_21]KKP52970.1 MAG: hypothetical protein UR43_C0008G0052 [candidate division TM6 bacterium GW2011_GWF2_33_332]HBS47792.1 hypothetical protein [Candidatus Dependentiae bacterium]HBZ73232.1 hypothetical protein [Candidatus Dependentiae bacterium]